MVNNIKSQTGMEGQDKFSGLLAVSIPRLAEMTGLSRSYLYLETKAGRLRQVKKGKRTVILVADALAWLNTDSASVPSC